MQTQTSNTLHNAIMEAGSKDRPPMLAPDKEVPIFEGSSVITTETYMETYKNVSQDIRDQLNAEAEAVQIILTWIDNDIYSTVDACPNACEMWKAIERLKQGESINVQDLEPIYIENLENSHHGMNSSTISKQAATKNRGKAIVNTPPPIYDQEPSMIAKDDEMSKDKEIDKLMDLISLSFKKIYKPTKNNLRTSTNTSRANQDNSLRINRGAGYDNQRANQDNFLRINRGAGYDNQRLGNIVGARETIEQADWRDKTDDESEDQELEAHYMYMAQIQEVSPDAVDFGPIFDTEPVQKNDDDDDLSNERELLASLIEKLKYEIDDNKNRNKFLETSNKALVEQLKETNALMYKDLKKFQAELDRRNDVEYASKVEIDCAKAKGDLISYKMESQKSFNKYTQQIC
nr:hypothetical protein [Tanacetum cinerariifolium]